MSDDWVVAMPKLGESVTEGTLGNWLKQVGDTVAMDDPLFEVSTDKVDSEVPSPYDGVIREILVGSGEVVPVGTPLVRIGEAGSAPSGEQTTDSPAQDSSPQPADDEPTPSGDSDGGSAGTSDEVHEVTLPKLGESVTEGTLGNWLKEVGDPVAMDDPLFELSTDKVDSEIPSPCDGVLLEILVPAGQTAAVGAVVARIGVPGAQTEPGSGGSDGGQTPPSSSRATNDPSASSGSGTPPAAEPGRMLSPLVRRLAEENSIDLSTVSGSGVGGRIRREDVEAVIEAASPRTDEQKPQAPAPSAAPSEPIAPTGEEKAKAAPGPRIPIDDRDKIEPLSRMRLTIAARMSESVRVAPHVWTSVEVDFAAIEGTRARFKDRFREQEGIALTQLAFVAVALCSGLREFPLVNSSLDMESKSRVQHTFVNLGVAVDLAGQGLVAPVVRDADRLNLRGLARAIREASDKATSGKFTADDLTGSTFTVTSPGPIADYASAPIINQPNSAIMSFNKITRRPVAVGDAIAIHPMSVLGFCYDHRSFDGVTASRFMAHVRDFLQDRDWDRDLAE